MFFGRRPDAHSHVRLVGTAAIGVALVAAVTGVGNAQPWAQRTAPSNAVSGTTIAPSAQRVKITQFATVEQPLAAVQRDNDDAMYVVQKRGRVMAVRNDVVDKTPVLDITSRVDSENERGLLGLAFSTKRRDVLYLDYTDKKGVVHVSEVPFDGKVADIAKERTLLLMPKPFNEHNAGTITFDGADMLLIGIGDGGGSGDKFNNGQRTDQLLGKVLRIDPTPSASLPYSIPADNPFAKGNQQKQRPEILAFGLRNPWRISVDRETGDVWIPDVGQNRFEEVNRLPKSAWGANYGWRAREGMQGFKGSKPNGAIDPVYAYPHLDQRCAIVGGFMYRGTKLPELRGTYLFGDVCSGQLAALRPKGSTWVAEDLQLKVSYLTAFGETTDGEPLVTSLEGGVYRLGPA